MLNSLDTCFYTYVCLCCIKMQVLEVMERVILYAYMHDIILGHTR